MALFVPIASCCELVRQEMNVEKAIEALAATHAWRAQSGAAEARKRLLADLELPFSDFPFSSWENLETLS